MILPTKHLQAERSLIVLGAQLLAQLTCPITVSELWRSFSDSKQSAIQRPITITFDQFILSLDFLFIIGAIDINQNLIAKRAPM
ncbi:MAG: ABC-three component system middle component 6 [Candidatus Hydrogenedentes bacterium]|nr:ABC-three component system middle component 6 [Candidatus Hydrogenedentota bacterium]